MTLIDRIHNLTRIPLLDTGGEKGQTALVCWLENSFLLCCGILSEWKWSHSIHPCAGTVESGVRMTVFFLEVGGHHCHAL